MKITTLIMALFFFGTPAKKSGNALTNTHWSFVKLVIGEVIQEVDTTCGTTLKFDKNGEFNGFSGWNNFHGKYSVASKGKLTMDNPMRTKKAGVKGCKLGEMLFDLYSKVESYTIKSDSLYLCTKHCVQMVFVRR